VSLVVKVLASDGAAHLGKALGSEEQTTEDGSLAVVYKGDSGRSAR
jgi:hypothetical protein